MTQTIQTFGASGTTNIASITNVTLFTTSIPANTLKGPLGQRLRVSIIGEILNNSAANRTYQLVGSFGGTVFAEDGLTAMPASASRRAISIDIDIFWLSSASQQQRMTLAISAPNTATTGQSGAWDVAPLIAPSSITTGSGAVNTANAQTLLVQIRADAATAIQSYFQKNVTIELV